MARNTPAMLAMPMAPAASAAPVGPLAPPGSPNAFGDPEPLKHQDLKIPAAVTVALLGFHVALLALALLGVEVALQLNMVLLTATAASIAFWLFRARTNTDGIGYRHQLPKAFAVVGWLIPLGFLYLPVRFVLDVWWARLPPGKRGSATARVLVWWVLWCLAWFTSFRETVTVTTRSNGSVSRNAFYSLYLGDTLLSCVFLLLAAVALIVVVAGISKGDADRS